MRLDELPAVALHEICLKLSAKDITSLQEVNRKLFHYIRANRVHYSKIPVRDMTITLTEDGKRIVEIIWINKDRRRVMMTLKGSVYEVIKSFNPKSLNSYDHDELANMHPVWWRERTNINLYDIIDYRRYLPYLTRCSTISLKSNNPMNLSEILASLKTQNLSQLSISGDGELECTENDFRKIGELSNNMTGISLVNMSESSNISNDVILDMIENGSFADHAHIELSRLLENMMKCLDKREWVVLIKLRKGTAFDVKTSNGMNFSIRKWGKDETAMFESELERFA